MIFFSIGDFAIRYFRGDTSPFMFGLPEAQVMDIGVAIAAAVMMVVLLVRRKPSAPAVAPVEAAEVSKSAQSQEG